MWRRKPSLAGLATLWRMLVALLRLNSHAGEARQFVYHFVVQADVELDGALLLRRGDRLIGRKHIAYVRGANLWQQLMNLEMTLVSQRHLSGTRVGNLVVNLSWFAKEHAAQLQLVDQENQPEAIADLLSFFAYVVRVMVGVHFWSLRLPDYPKDSLPVEASAPEPPSPYPYAEASGVTHKYAFYEEHSGALRVTGLRTQYEHAVGHPPAGLHICDKRLPPELPGLVRERYAVALPTRLPNVRAGFQPATMLLTRYRRPGQSAVYPPVLMLHGYGAGGTTFALDTVQQNLVQHLADLGFDVWVADLRTSIGLQTSLRQWVFEDIAYVDIPVAIQFVLQEALQPALHIVAHCVGAATFSMACLSGRVNPASILSAVLSQVGPLVEMPDMNRFRGYLAGYLKDYLDWDLLDITQPRRPFVELIDRILATYPFAKSDAPGESDEHAHVPTPCWRRIPHEAWCNRASAIFGPLYRHANLNQATLDNLGSLLGHVNFKTFQQTIFYATRGRITDHLGENPYVNCEALKRFFSFPVRFIHGAHNQVFHPEGSRRCAELLSAVFPSTVVGHNHVSCVVIENYGHQDCLIGANAHADVYGTISKFLLLHPRVDLRAALERDVDVLRAPRVGPVLGWLRWRAQTQTQPEAPIARLMFVPDTRSSPPSHAMTVVLRGDGRLCSGFARSHPLQYVQTAGLLPAATQQMPALKPLTATQVLDVELPAQPGDYRIVVLTLHAEPLPPQVGDQGRAVEAVHGQRLRSVARALADPHWHNVLPDEWAQRILEACPDDEVRGSMRAAWRVADLDYQHSTAVAHLGARMLAAAERAHAQSGPGLQVPFAFAVGSCRYAATPLDREQADASFGRLRELLALAPPERLSPQLLLLVGDQIYADATAGLFDASRDFDRYDARYREVWTAPNAREVLRRLPTYMMLDDHEIRNNAERDPRTQRSAAVAFESYQRCLAPHNPHHDPRSGKFAYWYAFEAGGCGFFVADTRTDRRRAPDASCMEDAIIGEVQQAELFGWLRAQQERQPDRPKFVVCPSVVLPLSRATGGSSAYALRSDGWDGFPRSLAGILDWIARHRIGQVVFVSGDLHCSLACEARLRHKDVDAVTTVYSIVSSGLYAPYPFANSQPRDVQQRFKGTLGEWYGIAGNAALDALVIDYDTRMSVHDDSFAQLGVRSDPEREGGLQLEVEFDSRAGVSRTSFALR
jgi:predicted alpha/beta hydrolase